MSRENALWGTERTRGELLKLGIAVSNRSIRRYRWRGPRRQRSQSWRTFLGNQLKGIWAADLLPSYNVLSGTREFAGANPAYPKGGCVADRLEVQETASQRIDDCFHAVARPQFAVNRRQVVTHGLLADAELPSHLFVGHP
jgi:hypothetical protein